MANHLQIVAILHIVFGVIGLLTGLFVVFILGGVAVFLGVSGPNGSEIAFPILSIVAFVMAVFIVISSVPGIIGGIGLLKRANWARILVIIISAIYIPFNIPLGTILGIYSLWVLFNNETMNLFEQRDL